MEYGLLLDAYEEVCYISYSQRVWKLFFFGDFDIFSDIIFYIEGRVIDCSFEQKEQIIYIVLFSF